MRILDYFDVIMYPIQQLVNLLKDSRISDYLFDGQVNLWQVLITFFVGALLIKFILAPVRLHLSDSKPVVEEPHEYTGSELTNIYLDWYNKHG